MLEKRNDVYNPDGAPSRLTAPPPAAPARLSGPGPDRGEDAAVPSPILRSALKYLDEGWRIFPVDHEKQPANAHGANGPYVESEADARRWWANGAKFGIAAACGKGLLVLDIDLPCGPASFLALEEKLVS